MTLPHHLVTVWNPSYAQDAMDEHLRVLLDWAGRARRGEADPDDIYVWWGRIRSPNRKGALPHAEEIAAIGHRVVHGGEKYTSPVVINEDVMSEINKLSVLAPLHNPVNLIGIQAAHSCHNKPVLYLQITYFARLKKPVELHHFILHVFQIFSRFS